MVRSMIGANAAQFREPGDICRFERLQERYRKVIALLDAIGLGAYSVVGVQKSLAAGLSLPAAIP